jgi:integrase/recombinase XerC
MNLINVNKEWLNWLTKQKGYSLLTIKAYEIDLQKFLLFFTSFLGKDITIEDFKNFSTTDFRSWLAYRHKNKLSAKSNARALAVIRNFYSYLNKLYQIENDAIDFIQNPKLSKNLPKALSEEQTFAALNNIELMANEDWICARNEAILTLIYGCGLRISEALSITKNQLNQYDDSIVITGKGGKQRVLPILLEIKQKINSYLAICPYHISEDSPIFLGVRGKKLQPAIFNKVIQNLRNIIGLPEHTTPHAFRHSFATHLLIESGDIRSIQELLGHASLSSTQIYTKIDQSKLAKHYKSSHPMGEE